MNQLHPDCLLRRCQRHKCTSRFDSLTPHTTIGISSQLLVKVAFRKIKSWLKTGFLELWVRTSFLSCSVQPFIRRSPWPSLTPFHLLVWMCFVFFCECQVLASLKCKLWVVQWEKLSVERLYCFFFYFSEQSKVQRTSVVPSSLPGNLWYPAPLCPRTQLWPNNLALFCYCPILEDVLINYIHPEYLKTSYNEKVYSHRKSEPAVGDSTTKI